MRILRGIGWTNPSVVDLSSSPIVATVRTMRFALRAMSIIFRGVISE
jgi:hypothetical protein